MDDWRDEPPEGPFRPTLRPVFVALLIVVACVALAVWTLQRPAAPPAPRPVPATETPTATLATRKERTPGPVTPRPTVAAPTPAPPMREAAPTAVPTPAAPPPTATPPPSLPPATATPRARHEPASLRTVAPPKVKRGAPTLLDVRGRALRPDHRVIVLRGGRVPPEIGVPRQKLVDSTLIQVLVVVGADAPKGEYDVAVADGEGRRSNSVHFEVIP